MTISIITVVYNGQSCIEKTIKSVLNQKEVSIEYIIIDGSSSDETMNIIEKYKKQIALVISEKDSGLYDAMNKGIQNATGDYLVFMNCDDTFYDSNTLSLVAQYVEANNKPEMIYGDSAEETSSGEIVYKQARSHNRAWYGMFAHHQAIYYKNEIIKNNNILYDLTYKIGSDYGFTLMVMQLSKQLVYINSPLCIFKQDGISSKQFYKGLKDQFYIRKNILKYNIITRIFIYMLHALSKTIRSYFPWLWNSIRFKGNK